MDSPRQTRKVGHSRIGITTTLLRENLSLRVATSKVKGTGCEGRGKKVASALEETKVMVPELLLSPWTDNGARWGEEEEGQGLTLIAGATMDRDGIQRDVQVSSAAPYSFKYQLWEGGGTTYPASPFASGSQFPA